MDSTTNSPVCPQCHGPLPSPNHKYCSGLCRNRANNIARYGERPTLICGHCGKEFWRPRNEKDARLYCSRECNFAAKAKVRLERAAAEEALKVGKTCKLPWGQCPECGRWWINRAKTQTCSDECYRRLASRNWTDHWSKLKVVASTRQAAGICEECGKSFAFTRLQKDLRYCSKRCTKKAERDRHPEREAKARRRQQQGRRARLRGVIVEQFHDREIFERDGWRCGICGKKVDRRLKHPHILSATLDHIIPLGPPDGHHIRANVQCAHLLCNSLKGNRAVGQQLRLIG